MTVVMLAPGLTITVDWVVGIISEGLATVKSRAAGRILVMMPGANPESTMSPPAEIEPATTNEFADTAVRPFPVCVPFFRVTTSLFMSLTLTIPVPLFWFGALTNSESPDVPPLLINIGVVAEVSPPMFLFTDPIDTRGLAIAVSALFAGIIVPHIESVKATDPVNGELLFTRIVVEVSKQPKLTVPPTPLTWVALANNDTSNPLLLNRIGEEGLFNALMSPPEAVREISGELIDTARRFPPAILPVALSLNATDADDG